MRALSKSAGVFALREVEAPVRARTDDVVVRVEFAGICRTDLHAADGTLATIDPVVLGHELSGIVTEGDRNGEVSQGTRVTVVPFVDCERCHGCSTRTQRCTRPQMLGIDRDGAFAELLVVRAAQLRRIPDTLSLRIAAYVEPVAASLAVLRAPIERSHAGLVFGRNRIAELTARILEAHEFTNVTRVDEQSAGSLEDDRYDFAIETTPTTAALAHLVRLLRPEGLLVLKSRPTQAPALDVRAAVNKDLAIFARSYGSFDDAIELLARGRLAVDDLLGESFSLEAFAHAFDCARSEDRHKLFFAIGGSGT